MEAVIAGLITSTGVLFLLMKINMRRCLGYDWLFDIGLTLGLTILFSDTYAGLSAAMIAGLILSIELIILKQLVGAERFDFKTRSWVEVKKGILK